LRLQKNIFFSLYQENVLATGIIPASERKKKDALQIMNKFRQTRLFSQEIIYRRLATALD